MKMTRRIEESKRLHDEAVEALEEYGKTIDALPEDTQPDERSFHDDALEELKEKAARAAEKLGREIAFQEAREVSQSALKSVSGISVGEEPKTYRKHGPHSYFRDLVAVSAPQAGLDDSGARERLANHGKDIREVPELRDVVSTDPGTASFIPPLYLGSEWIDKEVAGRPLADAIPKMPLSAVGKQMDFPRTQTAPAETVAASEAAVVNETDFDAETYSVTKVLISGQNDLSIQAYEYADPGMDVVIMRELAKSYNSVLDSQLVAGTGSNGQHRGLRNVSSINTSAFASGNAAALVGKIYDAVSQIATNAPSYVPNAVVMHPRRAAWIASHRDTLSNLVQQDGFLMASGSQNDGFAYSIAGLGLILDANIATNLGTNTNEDEIYVFATDELILAEGPQRSRVLTEVLSGTLQIRLQLFGFSAFAGGRRPKTICKISGAGLTPPVFPST